MDVSKKILILTLVSLFTIVLETEGKCSVDSIPDECSCPKNQPHLMQCTCHTASNKLTELPGREEIPDDVTFLLFLNCQFLSIKNVPYTNVESLHLRNSLVAKIEDGAFSTMNKLSSLDLSDNELRNLTKNMFSGLDNLRTLVVTGNNLGQIASDAFDELPKLEKLELSNNNGLQLPNHVFATRTHLKTVEIRQCGFKSIPSALNKAPSLRELDLDRNSLQSLNDNAFASMKKLNTLGLDSCAIDTVSDKAFDSLHELTVLNLGHNHIKSLHRRNFEAFRNKLQFLYLENNQLHTLSEDVLNWNQVQKAHLGHNPWTCDCSIHWISLKLYNKHNEENVTCHKPDEFTGKSLFNVTAHMTCEESSSKSAVALAVAIPIIIVCCVLIGYYVYKIVKNKRKGQHKSVRYSAVYKDTVESTKFRPTSDI